MAEGVAERWTRGWRGLLLVALIALAAALPGLALPVTDREEARTAQATAQMLESGDFVAINFQDQSREGRAIGVYWPQAASVAVLSGAEARQIWPYRVPSLIGAMLAAVGCAWGAAAFWGGRTGVLAGGAFAVTLLASTVGALATADAVAVGLTVVALGALARVYASAQGVSHARRKTRTAFWLALAGATLAGGWTPPLLAISITAILAVVDRRTHWIRTLGWGWGLVLFSAVLGPWLVAITVTTDGAFWTGQSAGSALGPIGGALAAVALSFPLIALAPTGTVMAWRERTSPGVRFALAWLVPAVLLFEFRPAANVADALYAFAPLAWLAGAAWDVEASRLARRLGAVLALAGGAALIGLVAYLLRRFGDADEAAPALATFVLLVAATLALALAAWRHATRALLTAAALLVTAQSLMVGVLAPGLEGLWPSMTVVRALRQAGLDPAGGMVKGPVTVAGYDEPSLVFSLGARTIVGDGEDAAMAIVEGRPAIVEAGAEPDFRKALLDEGVRARPIASVTGLDYAESRTVRLTIWRRMR